MSGQELATAVQEGAAVLVLVVNNGMYGTIRMHQEREYPAASSDRAGQPRLRRLRSVFGAFAERVERTDEFAAALERALAAGGPACSTSGVDPEAITPTEPLRQFGRDGRRERTETA